MTTPRRECLYADEPLHEDVCYMCAPRWLLAWWEIGYRWNKVLWFISRRLGGRPMFGRRDDPR